MARPIQPRADPPVASACRDPRAANAAAARATMAARASLRSGAGVAAAGQFGAAIQR